MIGAYFKNYCSFFIILNQEHSPDAENPLNPELNPIIYLERTEKHGSGGYFLPDFIPGNQYLLKCPFSEPLIIIKFFFVSTKLQEVEVKSSRDVKLKQIMIDCSSISATRHLMRTVIFSGIDSKSFRAYLRNMTCVFLVFRK